MAPATIFNNLTGQICREAIKLELRLNGLTTAFFPDQFSSHPCRLRSPPPRTVAHVLLYMHAKSTAALSPLFWRIYVLPEWVRSWCCQDSQDFPSLVVMEMNYRQRIYCFMLIKCSQPRRGGPLFLGFLFRICFRVFWSKKSSICPEERFFIRSGDFLWRCLCVINLEKRARKSSVDCRGCWGSFTVMNCRCLLPSNRGKLGPGLIKVMALAAGPGSEGCLLPLRHFTGLGGCRWRSDLRPVWV